MIEIWKTITGFSSYEINKNGLIRSKKHNTIMKTRKNNRGYHLVELISDDFESKTCLVHRLLALEFVPDTGINPDGTKMVGTHQVNHKDGDKDNISIENLEWCDQKYNMREAYRIGLRKYVPYEVTDEYREKMRKSSSKPSPGKEVQMLNKDTLEVIEVFESAVDAVKKLPELKLKDSGIRDAANHRRGMETYKGFRWKFTGNISNGTKARESKKNLK